MRVWQTVHAENVDQVDLPVYRVNFWTEGTGWTLDAYYLTEVRNVAEVLEWARETAKGLPFEVFVEADFGFTTPVAEPRRTKLVRLFGRNPNQEEPLLEPDYEQAIGREDLGFPKDQTSLGDSDIEDVNLRFSWQTDTKDSSLGGSPEA